MNMLRASASLVILLGLAVAAWAEAETPADEPAKKPRKPRVLVTISKETTRITEPLTKEGYPDYIAALNEQLSEGVTPENNAAVPLWKAMGPEAIDESIRVRFFKMLQMEPLPEEGDYYVELDDFAKRSLTGDKAELDEQRQEVLEEERDRSWKEPWTKKDCPTVAGYLAANQRPLALIVEATRRPRRYTPLIAEGPSPMLIAVLLPEIMQQREAARALSARAMLRLGENRPDEAISDLLACHRLARLSGKGVTLIDALVAIAIDGIACRGDAALLEHAKLTAAQARRMRADLEKLGPISNMADAIDTGERYMFLDAVTTIARKGVSEMSQLAGGGEQNATVKKVIDIAARMTIDWDLILRMGNTWYDRMVEAFRETNWAESRKARDRVEADLQKLAREGKDMKRLSFAMLGNPRKALSEQLGKIFVALMLPAVSAAAEAEQRGAMQSEVTKLGFALAAYRAERGRYPAKLADLVPKYVAEVPGDVFAAGPLKYRRQKGSYLLYSVGANGKDDGGRGYDEREDNVWDCDWDDLVVRVGSKR